LQERAIALAGRVGCQPYAVTAFDDAAALLLDTAAADPQPTLLVVGSRRLGVIGRLRLGSVSTKMIHAAPGPVLVVPSHHG